MFGSDRSSSSPICATCCSALTAPRVTLSLSGPAHVVSVRERALHPSQRRSGSSRPPISPPIEEEKEGKTARAHHEGTHARTRALLPKLEGRVGLPICLPTFLPTFPCPYCPWRSSNHLCRRSSTLGLDPLPFPEASFSERKANFVRTDGLVKSDSELVE